MCTIKYALLNSIVSFVGFPLRGNLGKKFLFRHYTCESGKVARSARVIKFNGSTLYVVKWLPKIKTARSASRRFRANILPKIRIILRQSRPQKKKRKNYKEKKMEKREKKQKNRECSRNRFQYDWNIRTRAAFILSYIRSKKSRLWYISNYQ